MIKDPCPLIDRIEIIRFYPEGMIGSIERLFPSVKEREGSAQFIPRGRVPGIPHKQVVIRLHSFGIHLHCQPGCSNMIECIIVFRIQHTCLFENCERFLEFFQMI